VTTTTHRTSGQVKRASHETSSIDQIAHRHLRRRCVGRSFRRSRRDGVAPSVSTYSCSSVQSDGAVSFVRFSAVPALDQSSKLVMKPIGAHQQDFRSKATCRYQPTTTTVSRRSSCSLALQIALSPAKLFRSNGNHVCSVRCHHCSLSRFNLHIV
jgi:hypothetical protein